MSLPAAVRRACYSTASLSSLVKSTAVPAPQPRQDVVNWQDFRRTKVLLPKDLSYDKRVPSRRIPAKRVAPTSKDARAHDIFHQLQLDPRDFSLNGPLLTEFLSELGKIQGREYTKLTMKNQRRLSKTIRRAKQMGVISNFSSLRSHR